MSIQGKAGRQPHICGRVHFQDVNLLIVAFGETDVVEAVLADVLAQVEQRSKLLVICIESPHIRHVTGDMPALIDVGMKYGAIPPVAIPLIANLLDI